jgi:hypothetical protein
MDRHLTYARSGDERKTGTAACVRVAAKRTSRAQTPVTVPQSGIQLPNTDIRESVGPLPRFLTQAQRVSPPQGQLVSTVATKLLREARIIE